MQIKPNRNLCFVEEIKKEDETKTYSGIIIHTEQKERTKTGIVKFIGKGIRENGKLVKPDIKVGDTVVYSFGTDIKLHGKEYTVLAEHDILATIS